MIRPFSSDRSDDRPFDMCNTCSNNRCWTSKTIRNKDSLGVFIVYLWASCVAQRATFQYLFIQMVLRIKPCSIRRMDAWQICIPFLACIHCSALAHSPMRRILFIRIECFSCLQINIYSFIVFIYDWKWPMSMPIRMGWRTNRHRRENNVQHCDVHFKYMVHNQRERQSERGIQHGRLSDAYPISFVSAWLCVFWIPLGLPYPSPSIGVVYIDNIRRTCEEWYIMKLA